MSPVEDIKSRLEIVDLIREYVALVQSGSNWKARCPFHEEKSPSFMVSQTKQVWHCFGCSEGGDSIAFLMKIENIDFPEALKILAQKTGVELPKTGNTGPSTSQKESVRMVLEAALQWYMGQLHTPSGTPALEYIQNLRALTPETIRQFSVGYAPSGWDGLSTFLSLQKFPNADILMSGLVIERAPGTSGNFSTNYYDRFRNRIMFPIHDQRGELIGFGGRLLPTVASALTNRVVTEEPKYINTPQTILYDKRTVLYGIDRAKMVIRSQNAAIILEGYMDVIASHQAGVTNAVATCGTALTREHLVFLKRFTDTVVLSFDMDSAGAAASKRGIDLLLQSGMKIGMIAIPEGKGKDADECIRADAGIWKELTGTFRPFLEVLWERAVAGGDLSKLPVQERVGKEFLPFVAKVSSPLERAYWVKFLSSAFSYPQEAVERWIASVSVTDPIKIVPPERRLSSQLKSPGLDIDHVFMGLLLLSPDIDLEQISSIVTAAMFEAEEPRGWFSVLLEGVDPNVDRRGELRESPSYARVITATEPLYGSLDPAERQREIERIAHSIRLRHSQKELAVIMQELKTLEQSVGSSVDTGQWKTLMERAKTLSQELSRSHSQ